MRYTLFALSETSTLQSTKGIILCDLNETILSPQNQLTVSLSDFSDCIARADNAGFVVGLCSDSSFDTLVEYAERFGMHGPLIIEKGAAYAMSKQCKPSVSCPKKTKIFPSLRNAFISALEFRKRAYPYHIVCGDANRIVEDTSQFASAKNGDVMIAVNGLRKFSFSFYVRKRVNGEWIRDPYQLFEIKRLALSVYDLLARWRNIDIDCNNHYGICIFHSESTSKRFGVNCMLRNSGKLPLHMIGDSIADHLSLRGVLQYAVANANDAYKKKCNRIATRPFTEGVIELIDAIAGHHV